MLKNKKNDVIKGSLYVFLYSLIFGVVVILGTDFWSEKSDIDSTIKRLELVGGERAKEVRLFIDGKMNRAVDFASDGFIKNSLHAIKYSTSTAYTEEVMRQLNRHLIVNKLPVDEDFYRVQTLNVGGIVVSSSDIASLNSDMSASIEFMTGRSGPYAKNLTYDTLANTPSLTLSAPVFRENELVGVIVIKMTPNKLNAILLDSIPYIANAETYIVDDSGYLVTPSTFGEGGHRGNSGVLTQLVRTDNVKLCLEQIADSSNSDVSVFSKSSTSIGIYTGYQGYDVIGTYYIIQGTDWCLFAEAKAVSFLQGIAGTFSLMVISALVIFAVLNTVLFSLLYMVRCVLVRRK